jgi:hypothetical protein
MATDKYPQRNVNVPGDPDAIAAAQARLAPPRGAAPLTSAPASNGKGSRRQIAPGEWVDDRVITFGGPASPSKDSPPEIKGPETRVLPTFSAAKVYEVKMAKPMPVDGRFASPANTYQMIGDVCIALIAADANCILDAVELGDIPVHPDAAPSE